VATQQATQAMQDVSATSEAAAQASRGVLEGSEEVDRTAGTLRGEVTDFLAAMSCTDEEERRRYERIAGNGQKARVRLPGQPELPAPVKDISRGGAAVECSAAAECGTEVWIVLPGTDGAVAARVVRTDGQLLALAFRQEANMLARIDSALDHIGGKGDARAA
jgi:methyl-accepting chemotaxis protein